MVLKLPEGVKWMFWEFNCDAEKTRQSLQNGLNLNSAKESILGIGFGAILSSKTFEKDIFNFFAHFWATKLKPFPGKVRQSVKDCLNESLIIENFWKTCYETTLRSKANVLSVLKWHFSIFCKFWKTKLKLFVGKATTVYYKALKTVSIKIWSYDAFYKFLFRLPWGQKRMFWTFGGDDMFKFFANF